LADRGEKQRKRGKKTPSGWGRKKKKLSLVKTMTREQPFPESK